KNQRNSGKNNKHQRDEAAYKGSDDKNSSMDKGVHGTPVRPIRNLINILAYAKKELQMTIHHENGKKVIPSGSLSSLPTPPGPRLLLEHQSKLSFMVPTEGGCGLKLGQVVATDHSDAVSQFFDRTTVPACQENVVYNAHRMPCVRIWDTGLISGS
ncbi:hypothetical protein AMTR_s00058p00151490, partial [Amborella trichopoda]